MIDLFRKMLSGASDQLAPADFKERRSAADVVIDVRTPGEYAGGHLSGALNMNVAGPEFRRRVSGLDRNKTYYLYCRSGSRSGSAAQVMRGMGFEKVYNIGGIDRLAAAGVEIER